MGFGEDLTVRGFRSTFKDWCSEQTGYPNEMALATQAIRLIPQPEGVRRGNLPDHRYPDIDLPRLRSPLRARNPARCGGVSSH
jgi:hypothetical protein